MRIDPAALGKVVELSKSNPSALPAAKPGSEGTDVKKAIAALESAARTAAVSTQTEEDTRVAEGEALAARLGILPDYVTPDGNTRQIMGATPSGIPLYAQDFSLQSNTDDTTDVIWAVYGLDGTGRTVGVWELGRPLVNHLDFMIPPALTTSRVTFTGTAAVSDHASAVCGILGGRGAFTSGGDTTIGGSYNSPIAANDAISEFTEMNGLALNALRFHNHSYGLVAGWTPQGFPGVNYVVREWAGDIRVSVAESALFGRYTTLSKQTDQVVRNRPWTLPVWAAGNDRGDSNAPASGNLVTVIQGGVNRGANYFYTFRSPSVGAAVVQGFFNGSSFWPFTGASTITVNLPAVVTIAAGISSIAVSGTPPQDGAASGYDCVPDGYGVAKNALTVGAMNFSTGSLASFSVFGPVDDGRIKPDIVTSGVGVFAPSSGSTSATAGWSGTSMAAPQVTGALNLMAQLQEDLWGGKHPLVASTYKALAIHTAQDYGTLGPDFTSGWGQLASYDAAALIESNRASLQRVFIKEVELTATEDADFTIKAVGGTPIKVTAVWTDPEAPTVHSDTLDPKDSKLVNNLDVELYRVTGGTRYYAWRLDPDSPSAAASRMAAHQDDTVSPLTRRDRNNVEQVLMSTPGTALNPAGTTISGVANNLYRVVVKKKGSFTGDANSKQRVSIVITGAKERSEYLFQVTAQSYIFVGGTVRAQLTWDSIAGENYRLEYSPTLAPGSWVDACAGRQYLALKDSTTGITEDVTTLGGSGFFRVATVAPNPFGLP